MPNLFSEFPKKTKAEWLAKVEKDLKGKPLDGLDWSLFDGMTMTPFFHADDLPEAPEPLMGGRQNNSWEIGEIVLVNDVKRANRQALEALEGGVTAIGFVLKNEISDENLELLLKGIQHEYISTHFYFEKEITENFVVALHALILKKGQSPKIMNGSISPSSRGAGGVPSEWKKLFPNFHFLTIKGENFYQKENPAEELSQIFGEAQKQIQSSIDEGMNFKEVASTIQFSLALGINYFLAIAKIRAFKLLWENFAVAYDEPDVECPPIEVHLATSSQAEDSDTNKISTTTQAMAAIIGGASRLYLLPSDAFENEEGTSFSRRIARNVQHLLQLESYLDRVVDPAAGSYFIENLTDALAERAWDRFRGQ